MQFSLGIKKRFKLLLDESSFLCRHRDDSYDSLRYFKTDVKEREHLGQRMLPKHEIPPVGEKRQVFLPAHS